MKKINFDMLSLTSVLCLVPMLFGLYFYQDLPEMVATHFDINNNPNGFMSRELFVFGMPIIMMLVQIFLCVIFDLKSKNEDKNNKSLFMYKLIIPFISVLMYVMIILYAMTFGVDISKVAMLILGVLFIVIGIDLPNSTNDSHINFPKINDEKVYTKTKKVFGIIFVIDGALALITSLFDSRYLIAIVLLLLIEAIGLLIFATWYNIKLNKKTRKDK